MFCRLIILYLLFFSLLHSTEQLVPWVVSKKIHDRSSFTQGLKYDQGRLFESNGLYGQSILKEIDPNTGLVIRQVHLPKDYFAEGLAIIDNKIFQMTLNENTIFIFDKDTFQLIEKRNYKGEQWGACFDGKNLILTNGTENITFLSPENLKVQSQLSAHIGKNKLIKLNDIECVNDRLYVNIWQEEYIILLDKQTGKLIGNINASNLLTNEEKKQLGSNHVLNGIAYNPDHQTFFITGKGWPWLFEVEFITLEEHARKTVSAK